jgi:hypothetical protein
VAFSWQIDYDTVTVNIQNLSSDSVSNFFLSDFTDSLSEVIECLIDGVIVDSLPTDLEFGTVYPNMYSTRWVVGDFATSLYIKYRSSSYDGYRMSWSAGHPYPIFGILSVIGPPIDPAWRQ